MRVRGTTLTEGHGGDSRKPSYPEHQRRHGDHHRFCESKAYVPELKFCSNGHKSGGYISHMQTHTRVAVIECVLGSSAVKIGSLAR